MQYKKRILLNTGKPPGENLPQDLQCLDLARRHSTLNRPELFANPLLLYDSAVDQCECQELELSAELAEQFVDSWNESCEGLRDHSKRIPEGCSRDHSKALKT